jgi:hypothetical protein
MVAPPSLQAKSDPLVDVDAAPLVRKTRCLY